MMNALRTGTCAAIVGLATAVIGAQATAPQQNQATSSDRKITVTGCLKASPSTPADTTTPPATTGTSGTAGTTASSAAGTTGAAPDAADAKFLLTNVAPSAGDSASTTGTTGTTTGSAATTGASATTYRLIANPAALSPHVGKKLELTGTLMDENSAADSSTAASGPEANAPKLKVEAGKVIAATCEP